LPNQKPKGLPVLVEQKANNMLNFVAEHNLQIIKYINI